MAVAIAVAAVGTWGQFQDTPLLAMTIAAFGLLWAGRSRGHWAVACALVSVGLFWSGMHASEGSVWRRGSIVYEKLSGGLPYFAWQDIPGALVAPNFGHDDPPKWLVERMRLLERKTIHGARLERYRTEIGDFWINENERDILAFVTWELAAQSVYESREVVLHPGDTVIDCGAHVGVFTRYALNRGAARVVAVEPDPQNLIAFEANLAEEIASGKVTLIRGGVWIEETVLALARDEGNSASRSFVYSYEQEVEGIPVFPLDTIVADQNLDRVDFVKMDIEGSERLALKGAVQTIERFKPRMAICTYHLPDDPRVIPRLVMNTRSDYLAHVKDLDLHGDRVRPKVVFFN